MFVHWKSLIWLGLAFWALLCCTDTLGRNVYRTSIKQFYESYDGENEHLMLRTNEKLIKFGWSLLIWNSITLIFSIMFCYWIRTLYWLILRTYRRVFKNKSFKCLTCIIPERSDSSKIPVMVKAASSRLSDSHLRFKFKVDPQGSCPNLFTNRSKMNANTKVCHTLYQNSKLFTAEGDRKFNRHMDNQCSMLREEMARMQANSLKEHAVLISRLECVTKDKKDMGKQLSLAQKENRAAKQQLEELLQERGVLVKRLENTAKEFKCNTKAKKLALAKLEEVTASADTLKQQLEQITRDKEILENKLKVLEVEYEQLQERHRAGQTNLQNFHTAPERDTDGRQEQELGTLNEKDYKKPVQRVRNRASISQSELEMKKIEQKIKQLERNLENLNTPRNDIHLKIPEGESEISLSLQGNNTDNQLKTDDDTDASEPCSPTRYWGGRAGDMVTHIQAINHKMNDKFRGLNNIKERCREDSELDEYSGAESLDDIRPPKRIVSSSMAFQKFLKNLSPGYTRQDNWAHHDVHF